MEKLLAGARRLGIDLSPKQQEQFRRYGRLLEEGNLRANLTSVTRWERVQLVHFLDSLTVATALTPETLASGRMLDVESGAGFPGVPLKVAFPGIALVLLDSVHKKTGFLEHLGRELDLGQVEVLTVRAEELAHQEGFREAFDAVTARALGKLPVAVELTLPFARVGGVVVAQKKGNFAQELDETREAISLLGGAPPEVRWLELPELGESRALIVIRKMAPTPARYPRRPGIPFKRPLVGSRR